MMVLDDDEGVVIAGATQAGKTVFANFLHEQATDRIRVFYNPDLEPYVRGTKAQTVRAVVADVDSGKHMVDFRPDAWAADELRDAHGRLVGTMFEAASPANPVPMMLSTDEAHEIAREGQQGTSLHRVHKRGQKRGIKAVSITQDLSQIPNSVIRQAGWKVYVGRPDQQSQDYLEGHGYPFEVLRENGDHEAAVMRNRRGGGGLEVVERVTVPARYASA